MLLERIDIDSRGTHARVQLGPFSNRLNVVFGPPGSGKTATIEFVRSVMLGTDRHWRHGVNGAVVWADRNGLLHCRRELDGTTLGRLMVDYVDRNGRPYEHHYGYRSAENYDRLDRLVEVPRRTLDAVVAPSADGTPEAILDACRQAGLDVHAWRRDDEEIARVSGSLREIEAQLEGYTAEFARRDELVIRRRELIDQIAHLQRQERKPQHDARRDALVSRLNDAQDEVERLRGQESDLRQALSELDRELMELAREHHADSALQIASARRAQLAGMDHQLTRMFRTLREIRAVNEHWPLSSTDALSAVESTFAIEPSVRFHATYQGGLGREGYRLRLDTLRRHLTWLVGYHEHLVRNGWAAEFDEADEYRYGFVDAAVGSPYTARYLNADVHYLERAELDALLTSARNLIGSLEQLETASYDSAHRVKSLADSEASLTLAIGRLVDARHRLLEQIAREHNVSHSRLLAAFGDWKRCHDQPHLYEWLLSEHFPPQAEDSIVRASRRRRLEVEQRELLDELSRTANRLDDSVRETRNLRDQLHRLPVQLPIVVETERLEWLRGELTEVERRLRWIDSRQSMEDQRRQLRRRLETLRASHPRVSPLLRRADHWLSLLTDGRVRSLSSDAGLVAPQGHYPEFVISTALGGQERRVAALALRLAAAEQLREQGLQIPLLVDEPYYGWLGENGKTRLTSVLASYADRGNQLVVFTAHRGLAETLRSSGAHFLTMQPSHYYQMRYRETWSEPPASINQELDTAWREANGLYDDPYWYRPNHRSVKSEARGEYRYDQSYTDYPQVRHLPLDADLDPTSRVSRGPASPFFLTEASPVDQAPSVDAVAAERLRTLGITTVGQLLAANPHRVAERLQLADVSPEVVMRWQHEANLVCGVPQLRSFDARVLVGCGFTDPQQLARMHPGQLLEKVEAFLATDRGRQILRTGTSYELSRITSWIAAANRSVSRRTRHGERADRRVRQGERVYSNSAVSNARPAREMENRPTPAYQETRPFSGRDQREREMHDREDRRPRSSKHQRRQRRMEERAARQQPVAAPQNLREKSQVDRGLRFYLELESPIVDAPSIGPKTAERLSACGYRTVRAFLEGDAGMIASKLNNRRITSETIRAWQHQSGLMCQTPMLRGHDAQLLVEAGIVSPSDLASQSPERLLARIDPIARSSEGKRILRGASLPDLAEVTDWIKWAQARRPLKAA